jgi:hypothetical protein
MPEMNQSCQEPLYLLLKLRHCMMKAIIKARFLGFIALVGLILTGFYRVLPDEGMYPMSEISKLDLKKAGMRLTSEELFNPGGVSIADALVRVGGCTGSFVSSEGLIVTNHHCAFGAVQASSSVENDYIEDGFLARRQEEEIEAKGITCKITQSYSDVSDLVLSAVQNESDPAARLSIIAKRIKEIETSENEQNPGLSCEVSEMFAGRTYVLFRYQIIRDVRLVYVPPRNIGEFGGEADNWEWPRHTGDFSFLRAYVSPDGKPAPYNPNNVPFKPKKHLQVNPEGVKEGDFVFILGYPGRTFRNQPARFLAYQEKYQLPYIADLFESQIQTMKELGKQDRALEIRVASRIKSLANVSKNYRGKLEGLKELQLTNQRIREDEELGRFIQQDPDLSSRFGSLMKNIDQVFDEMDRSAPLNLWMSQIYSSAGILSASSLLIDAGEKLSKTTSPEEYEKVRKQFVLRMRSYLTEMDESVDLKLLTRMVMDARKLPAGLKVQAIEGMFKSCKTEADVQNKLVAWRKKSIMVRPAVAYASIGMPVDSLRLLKDPLLQFVFALKEQADLMRPGAQAMAGRLNQLLAAYVEVKMKQTQTQFIPDANATLRLTYGYIKGYSVKDAVHYQPETWLSGMIEKSALGGDYTLHPKIKSLFESKVFGNFAPKGKSDIPLAILYNTDTSGGNSGSPVMDADGKLIGINFDRAYPATINDYAWNDRYSRSIGVDMRFVLWVTQYVSGADFLLKEMGV